jgi:endonuclease YncB( thermonuclease family)
MITFLLRLPDGRSLNQELVRAGYAWWFRRYSADPVLARLEADARRARRGLWADPRPTPPWEYRPEMVPEPLHVEFDGTEIATIRLGKV